MAVQYQKIEITRDMFERYESTRLSGKTNMFHASEISRLSGLSTEEIKTIMRNYGKYKKNFLDLTDE